MSALFPSHCRLCQLPLTELSRLPVCEACLALIQPMDSARCAACGERMTTRSRVETAGCEPEPLCLECRQNQPAFTRAAAYASYAAGLRDLVHLLKYQRVRPAADVLGRMLAEVVADLAEAFGPEPPLAMPVPLHASKLRERGFNQSELIARSMLKLKPAALDMKLNTGALVRQRRTESQTGLTAAARRDNVRGAFLVVRGDTVRGRDILLIDDVFTTGTTVSECARVLRKAGAERVFVATVARVLKPQTESEAPDFEEPRVLAAHA